MIKGMSMERNEVDNRYNYQENREYSQVPQQSFLLPVLMTGVFSAIVGLGGLNTGSSHFSYCTAVQSSSVREAQQVIEYQNQKRLTPFVAFLSKPGNYLGYFRFGIEEKFGLEHKTQWCEQVCDTRHLIDEYRQDRAVARDE